MNLIGVLFCLETPFRWEGNKCPVPWNVCTFFALCNVLECSFWSLLVRDISIGLEFNTIPKERERKQEKQTIRRTKKSHGLHQPGRHGQERRRP